MLIDVHNHSMPGVDDGSPDANTTFRMFQMAYQNGIRAIILTPHYRSSMPDEITHNRYKAFRKALWIAEKVSPELKLYLGAELFYDSGLLEKLKNGRAPTLNGTRYVLVEFPVYAEYSYINHAVRELWGAGYYPILAHIERYEALRKKERVEELIRLGAYIQVNADSVTGKAGLRTKWYLLQLIREDMVHLVGTDAHNMTKRPPQMEECAIYLQKKAGIKKKQQLCRKNARKVIEGEKIGE